MLVVQQKKIKKDLRKKNIKVNLHQNLHLLKVQLLLINNQIQKIELKMQVFLNLLIFLGHYKYKIGEIFNEKYILEKHISDGTFGRVFEVKNM